MKERAKLATQLRAALKKLRRGVSRILKGLLNHLKEEPPTPTANEERFQRDLNSFLELDGKVAEVWPILTDFYDDASGVLPGHYFNQDLLVASLIAKAKPRRHIDVGSSFTGFVAHVASFRAIEVLDIRPLEKIYHPQISFLQKDLTLADPKFRGVTDSLSCLHTIEHFGLGRYGDNIDPEGHLKGFQNLVDLLEPGGTLYISFPIGAEDAVHFNAHRVFHPRSILDWPLRDGPLRLTDFSFEDDLHRLHQHVPLDESVPDLAFGCGIYTFQKT